MICFNFNLKNKINKIKQYLKQKLTEYFFTMNSMESISKAMKKCFIISVGFNEIYNRIKNPKRFKLCLLIWIFTWIQTIVHFLVLKHEIWLFIDYPLAHETEFGKTIAFLYSLNWIGFSSIQTDFVLGELNGHLDAFKLFHTLTLNQSMHKLNDKNYKRLSLLSRLFVIISLYCFGPLISIAVILFNLSIAINSHRLIWWFNFILVAPPVILQVYTLFLSVSVVIIYFLYYKMRFDQLNDQLKSLIPRGRRKFIIPSK